MRPSFLASIVLLVLAGCSQRDAAPPPESKPADTAEWASFGAGVAAGAPASIPVTKLLAEAPGFDGKTVVVEGTVAEVCQNKGCWLTVQDSGREMRVRFKDYAFFVPKDCAGKTVRAEGVFAIEKVPVEEARHYLEDAGKHDEAMKITEPVDSYTFMASGVQLR